MDRYIKIKMSPRDKMNLLLFDLIPERFLYQENSKPSPMKNVITDKTVNIEKKVDEVKSMDVKEDTLMFFEYMDDSAKTNF